MNAPSDTTCRIHVLAVSSFECDHIALAHIFGHTAWKFDTARTMGEATRKLLDARKADTPLLILCDEVLADGTWQDLLLIAQQQEDPNCLIVTSQRPDDRLWAEVLNLGAYDVLSKPLQAQEVFRTIGLAWHQVNNHRKTVVRALSHGTPHVTGAVA